MAAEVTGITTESVNKKLQEGKPLTKEEQQFVMSLPPEAGDGLDNKSDGIVWPEEDGAEATTEAQKKEPPEGETPEEKQAREAAEAEDKKAKDALAARAKAAGLAEDSKEEDIAAAEEKKRQEDAAKDPLLKIETELQKPEGQENLEGFTEREKAYFHQMRRDRRSRQKAEEDLAVLQLEKIKTKKEEKPLEVKEEDPLEALRKRDPTDFLTAKEVIETIEKVRAADKKKEDAPVAVSAGGSPARQLFLDLCDEKARAAHPDDYDAVMELSKDILETNEKYGMQVAEDLIQGKNPAEKAYELIKGDPEFPKLFPAAKTRVEARKNSVKKDKTPEEIKAEQDARAAAERLKNNQDKPKTTGHASGEGSVGEGDKIDGYSFNDIVAMSPLEYSRIPKKTRDKIMEAWG